MTIKDVLSFIKNGEIKEFLDILRVEKEGYFLRNSIENAIAYIVNKNQESIHLADFKAYHADFHDVNNDLVRLDKRIYKPAIDDRGIIKPNQQPVLQATVKLNRISLPIEERIVDLATAFLGIPKLDSNPETDLDRKFLSVIQTIHDDNRMDAVFAEIERRVFSEREAAGLWFTQDAEKGYWDNTEFNSNKKLRIKVLSPFQGDILYPVFDSLGDLVAFCHYYKTSNYDDVLQSSIKVINLDIYTKDTFYYYQKINETGDWIIVDSKGQPSSVSGFINPTGKIPVEYYVKPYTEAHHIQSARRRIEFLISNHGDTNDYNGSPIIFAEGEVEGFADKGETGKLITGKGGAKLSYVTWDNAPESIKMEIENLLRFINTYTQTPDISFDNIKGIGAQFTGVALQMFFMDAHLKAMKNEQIFGPIRQRGINYIKVAIIKLDPRYAQSSRLVIKPKFTYFLPRNIQEEIANIVTCLNNKIMSRETAVKLNPLITDWEAELKKIENEQAVEDQRTIDNQKALQTLNPKIGDVA